MEKKLNLSVKRTLHKARRMNSPHDCDTAFRKKLRHIKKTHPKEYGTLIEEKPFLNFQTGIEVLQSLESKPKPNSPGYYLLASRKRRHPEEYARLIAERPELEIKSQPGYEGFLARLLQMEVKPKSGTLGYIWIRRMKIEAPELYRQLIQMKPEFRVREKERRKVSNENI